MVAAWSRRILASHQELEDMNDIRYFGFRKQRCVGHLYVSAEELLCGLLALKVMHQFVF